MPPLPPVQEGIGKLEWVQLRSWDGCPARRSWGSWTCSAGAEMALGELDSSPQCLWEVMEEMEMGARLERGRDHGHKLNQEVQRGCKGNFFCVRTVRWWHRLPRDVVQSPTLGFWPGWMRPCTAWPDLRADIAGRRRLDQRHPDVPPNWNDPVTLWMPSVGWPVLAMLLKTALQNETEEAGLMRTLASEMHS